MNFKNRRQEAEKISSILQNSFRIVQIRKEKGWNKLMKTTNQPHSRSDKSVTVLLEVYTQMRLKQW